MNESELKELAAGIFGVPSNDLALGTSPDDLPQWDSLNHLNLITAFESRANVRLSMQQIQSISVLGDLLSLQNASA